MEIDTNIDNENLTDIPIQNEVIENENNQENTSEDIPNNETFAPTDNSDNQEDDSDNIVSDVSEDADASTEITDADMEVSDTTVTEGFQSTVSGSDVRTDDSEMITSNVDYSDILNSIDTRLSNIESIQSETLFSKPFDDYSVSEGLLFIGIIIVFICCFWNIITGK